ncbi:T9SS type A sorting domain-containing protein [Flavobacterium sp. DGU11]|uniref:T9SS type A sorting domain-containing protein n=1 Tax=Flavobacterium arundinis TaxID=3139143 RepID=A0ABU9HR72_9FLAO
MKQKLLLLALFTLFSFQSFAQAEAYPVQDIVQCNSEVFDLTAQTPITLGNQDPLNFTVNYYLSWQDAEDNTNPITNPTAFMITTGNIEQALYIRVTNTNDGSFDTTSFVVGFWPAPFVPDVSDIAVCDSFVLPALESGNYYTDPSGSGAVLPAGTVVVDSQMLYIYASNGSCSNQSSFTVTILNSPETGFFPEVVSCESYTLPALPQPFNYYTGQGGTGTQLSAGDVVTTSQVVYIMGSNGSCVAEYDIYITITNGVDCNSSLEPLTACDVNGDGVAAFDLEPIFGIVYNSTPGILNMGIYETYLDAQNGTNAIGDINSYTNINPGQQVLYVGIVTENGVVVRQLELVVTQCEGNFTVSGHVAYDADGNGCDENDPPAAGVQVYYISGNYGNYAYTDANGNYTFYNVPTSEITVYVNTYYPTNLISSPANYPLAVDDNFNDINFCLMPPAPVTDVAVYVYPMTAAQPGFAAGYMVAVYNYGNTPANGTVSLQFNDTQLDYTSSVPAAAQSGNVLTFNYGTLQPYQTSYIYVNFTVGMPGVVDLGDVLSFTATVTPLSGDANTANNTYEMTHIATNSWDPNDINVREGEQITELQADGYLHYTIRFQNMGNANAHNVKVLTILDDNLDWTTFQTMVSSHSFQTNRGGNGSEVEFRFTGIELPGTNNEPESHGFIEYRIKPKANVEIGDVFEAQAGIYFDFNPVVNTNSITTTIMDTAGNNDFNAGGFVMYPNPASSKVTLEMQSGTANNASVTVTDVLGKIIVKTTVHATQSDIDVSSLKSGVYFITLNADGKLATKKLVIK